jgi:phosphate transport system substrate-binding protein
MLKTLGAALGAALIVAGATVAQAATISGAGATFPAPVYAKWAETYKAQTGNALNYQAIGSGGGIKQITAGTVDFGASDKPLKPDDLATAGLVMFPTVVGGVVPVVNLPGFRSGQIKLNGAQLADIYRGVIKKWNDPLLAKTNPGLALPNMPITVVHRSDGSGTTFLFTSYLTMKAAHWAQQVGGNDSVQWPTGIGGKGNDGVAAFVRQTPGAIGYVEYAYAKQNGMTYTLLQNKAGKFVSPTAENFAAAAAGAKWQSAPGFYLLLLDQAAPDAWPITGATFILVKAKQ